MFNELMRKKPIAGIETPSALKRTLNAVDLTLMGIGAIIGAGVFVLTGIAAATEAGPAIVLSYLVTGLAAMFAALAYAELASSIGGTGSAYSYAYAGFGELFAWIIGWNLLLEYAMAVVTVAIGWSGYVNNLFEAMGIHLPLSLTKNPFDGGGMNLLATFVVLALAGLLCFGIRTSARFNAVIVFIKLITIFVFIAVASTNVNIDNWQPFMPYGWSGVMGGAALVFFAYVGFDALSTTVEETINPGRNVPIGIITSLIFCTTIYIIVSALLTGIVPYQYLNVRSPVADALLRIGHHTAAGLIAAGAIAGLTTVILVMYYGMTRICLAIARDGLISKKLAVINARTHSPIRLIVISGIILSILAGFAPIDKAAEMVNIGTLAAFAFVSAGVILFRYQYPDLKRPFKLPFYPVIPILGVIFCLLLMINLAGVTWLRFLIWTAIGVAIYFIYGKKHSLLA